MLIGFLVISILIHASFFRLRLSLEQNGSVALPVQILWHEVSTHLPPTKTEKHRGPPIANAPARPLNSPVPSVNSPGESRLGVQNYENELRREIETHKEYPARARARRQQGSVDIGFTILSDGTLEDVHCSQPSAFVELNESALNSVRDVKKFKPFPREITASRLELIVPITFILN